MTIALSTQPFNTAPNTANPFIAVRFTEEASPRLFKMASAPN